MKIVVYAVLSLFGWAIFKGGDTDPDWYDEM